MPLFKDLTGRQFGELKVLTLSINRVSGRLAWECVCTCGNYTVITSKRLIDATTKSCGCLKISDLSNKRFGKLIALSNTGKIKRGYFVWSCLCDCGSFCEAASSNLIGGNTKSCGCNRVLVLAGQRFGLLTVLSTLSERTAGGNVRWLCQCDCGNRKEIISANLVQGRTTSCGCKIKLPEGEHSLNSVISRYKKSAFSRGLDFCLTTTQCRSLFTGSCFYCGLEPLQYYKPKAANGGFLYNGIDRVNNTKGYVLGNCVSCCKKCNVAKYTYTFDEFSDWVEKVYNNLNKVSAYSPEPSMDWWGYQ